MVVAHTIRRRTIGADGGGGGGFTAPVVGTVTPFTNSVIAGSGREFTFTHVNGGGSSPGLVLVVVLKGSTDVGPPTFTLDKAAYDGTSMLANELGRNSSNLFATAPTILAFSLASPSSGENDVEFDITPSTGDVQCIGMAAIDLTNFGGNGSGIDSDISIATGTSQSIAATTGQDNSLALGITAARNHANGGTITTPAGFAEHVDLGTDFSSSTDIGFAVHTIVKASAGSQAYATSWSSAASYGSLLVELEGV